MELAQVGGPAGQATDKVAPCIQIAVHVHCDLDVPSSGPIEGMLHFCENAP